MIRKSKKGFTLIELVIAMAIIAVLLLLATGRYRHHVERANDIHIIADTNSLQKELKTELLHENKEFKGNPVDKNNLVGKKIYSARKIEEEIPEEELYEVNNPKEYLNTVLTGKFIASANADTYYVDNSTKSNKPNPNPNPFDNIDYDNPDDYGDNYDVIERDTAPPVEIEETISIKNQPETGIIIINKAGEKTVYHISDKEIAAELDMKLQENENLEVKIYAKPMYSEQEYEVTRIDVKVDGEFVDILKLM